MKYFWTSFDFLIRIYAVRVRWCLKTFYMYSFSVIKFFQSYDLYLLSGMWPCSIKWIRSQSHSPTDWSMIIGHLLVMMGKNVFSDWLMKNSLWPVWLLAVWDLSAETTNPGVDVKLWKVAHKWRQFTIKVKVVPFFSFSTFQQVVNNWL